MAKKENENGLKPHYAPNVKPYKKGIEVYPHTDFRHMEIYPHTEFHKQEPFWLYREVGLLKNWLMSLTKLYNLITIQETEDVTDLTQEIKDLIDKLAFLINSIQTDLEALVVADKNYKANVSSMLEKINSLTNDITNLIITLNPLFSDLFNCIENRLFVFDNYINEINNEINNIWTALQDVLKGNTTTSTLTLGTDYTMTYYNGWYCSRADSPTVRRSRTTLTMKDSSFYTDTITIICNTNCYFTNDAVLTSSSDESNFPTFAHANARNDVPLSWLYAIHFLNSNYSSALSLKQDSSDMILDFIYGDWNTSARATWAVETGLDKIADGSFRNSLVNIEDGFNSQYYYDYPTNLGLTFGNFNNRMELIFQYTA